MEKVDIENYAYLKSLDAEIYQRFIMMRDDGSVYNVVLPDGKNLPVSITTKKRLIDYKYPLISATAIKMGSKSNTFDFSAAGYDEETIIKAIFLLESSSEECIEKLCAGNVIIFLNCYLQSYLEKILEKILDKIVLNSIKFDTKTKETLYFLLDIYFLMDQNILQKYRYKITEIIIQAITTVPYTVYKYNPNFPIQSLFNSANIIINSYKDIPEIIEMWENSPKVGLKILQKIINKEHLYTIDIDGNDILRIITVAKHLNLHLTEEDLIECGKYVVNLYRSRRGVPPPKTAVQLNDGRIITICKYDTDDYDIIHHGLVEYFREKKIFYM